MLISALNASFPLTFPLTVVGLTFAFLHLDQAQAAAPSGFQPVPAVDASKGVTYDKAKDRITFNVNESIGCGKESSVRISFDREKNQMTVSCGTTVSSIPLFQANTTEVYIPRGSELGGF